DPLTLPRRRSGDVGHIGLIRRRQLWIARIVVNSAWIAQITTLRAIENVRLSICSPNRRRPCGALGWSGGLDAPDRPGTEAVRALGEIDATVPRGPAGDPVRPGIRGGDRELRDRQGADVDTADAVPAVHLPARVGAPRLRHVRILGPPDVAVRT